MNTLSHKDYSLSPTPHFDAVEDVMDLLGDKWPVFRAIVSKNPDAYRDTNSWLVLCAAADVVDPFQQEAWYDHHFGQGKWQAINELERA